MRGAIVSFVIFVLFLPAALCLKFPKDKAIRCQACEITVAFLDHVLDQVDPKKMIQVGSRNNADRSKRKFVPLKMSETRVTEVLESLCEDLPERDALAYHAKDGKWKFLFNEDAEKGVDEEVYTYNKMFKHVVHKHLKRFCFRLLSDYEGEILEYLFDNNAEDLDLRNKICYKMSGYCKKSKKRTSKKHKIFPNVKYVQQDGSEGVHEISEQHYQQAEQFPKPEHLARNQEL